MTRKGLTLIEILLVFSLVAILATGAFISFLGVKANQALSASAENLQTVLNRARMYARDGRDEKAWGVIEHGTTGYDLVEGSPGDFSVNRNFGLESPTRFGGSDFLVWFQPGSGDVSTGVDILLTNQRGAVAIVSVKTTGLIEVNK
jgi:prepilin-type N-terminal cleavage/methylation domain-containing protein